MYKKLQLLKWALRLSALLFIGIASFGGTLPITQATPTSTCRFFYVATPSTTYTPPNTQYDVSVLPTSNGLQGEVKAHYELHCDAPEGTCTLVSGTGGAVALDITNFPSPGYFHDGLANFSFNCTPPAATTSQGTLVQGGTCHLSISNLQATPPTPPLEPGNVTTLDTSLVPNDAGLKSSLDGPPKATLTCDKSHKSCQLNTTGVTVLDTGNFGSSTYYTNGLKNYKLSCFDS